MPSWLDVALRVIGGLAPAIALALSVYNLRLLRIHSSPKPFLVVTEVTTAKVNESVAPRLQLSNRGVGLAVKVSVTVDATLKNGGTERLQLCGPEVVPTSESGDNTAWWYETCRQDVHLPERLAIHLKYQSDSGYVRIAEWQWRQTPDGREVIVLIRSS